MWTRIVCAVVALLWAVSACGQVTVTGPVRTPTGDPWDGELRIQSQMMFCNGVTYPPTLQRVSVVNGQLNVSVQPTDVCGTGYSYTVYYIRWGRTEHVTYWIVPSTPATTTVEAVQASVAPSPQLMIPLSQLGTPGPAGSVIVSSGTAWVPGSAMLDVTQAVGDLIYRGSAGALARLPVGAAGQVLSSDGSVPTWSAPSGGGTWGSITGTLSDQTDLWAALGGKANTSHTHGAGDIVSGTMATARLGSGTPTSSTFLRGDSTWSSVDWASIAGKPGVFPPSSHNHLLSDLEQSGATTGQIPKWDGSTWVPASDDIGSPPSWGSITGTLSSQTDLQSALDGKASASHTHAAGDIDSGAVATARLGSGTASSSTFLRGDQTWNAVGWADVSSKPSTFPPSSHTHPLSELSQSGATTGQVAKWNGSTWAPAADDTGTAAVWGNITGTLSNQTDLQTALDSKASTSHTHAAGDVTSGTFATARLGSGTANSSTFLRGDQTWNTVEWTDITGKPSTFPPSSHSHPLAELNQSGATTGQIPKWNGTAWVPASDDTGGSPSWGSITGTLSNQTDLQAALDGKASTSHTHAASDTTSGVFAPARLGTGTPSSSTYLRGDGTWATVSTGEPNYSQSFTAQTSVSLAHNAGTTNVLVSCYDSSNVEVVPQSVVVTSANVVDVTFSEATTGRCVVNSSGGGGGGGGAATWGSITGTLSDQTDLQAALDSKSPTTHTHSGAEITSGTIAPQRLGTGTPDSTNFLRGDGTWVAVSGGSGTVYTGAGLTGDGSQTDPVRVDPSGGVASQAAYQATIDFGSIGGGSCAEWNVTAAGVAAGTTIAPGWPATLPMGLVGMMYAGSDVIVVRLCNVTSGALDPPNATYTARVVGGF